MRKLAAFAAAFSLAIVAVCFGIPAGLVLPLAACCTLVALVAGVAARKQRLRIVLICIGFAAGLLWCRGYDAIYRTPARAMENKTMPITATVADWPSPTSLGVSVPVRIAPEQGPAFMALLYADPQCETLIPGDVVTFLGRCRPADSMRGKENMAYPARGIFLITYAQGEVSARHPEQIPAALWPVHWAKSLQESVTAAFPPDVAPLVRAVVTGNRDTLSDAFTSSLQRAGLAHAVAVSGMHIAFLAGLILQLFGRYKKRTALVAIPVLLLFMLAAGCTPSVVRAVVMQLLLLLAPIFGRESDTATNLAFALMLLLAQNPYAAASVSLQLSFASVAGIMVFSGRIYDSVWERLGLKHVKTLWGRMMRAAACFVLASLATTLGAIAFTTPLMAYYFGAVSLVAPLTNLLSLWAVSFLFLGGLLAGVFALFALPLGQFIAFFITPLARYLVGIIPILSAVPFAAITLKSVFYTAWLTFTYAVILLCIWWRGEGRRPIVPVCCCTVTLCAAVLITGASYHAGRMTVTVLNTGQGQSVLFRAGTRTLLVDCGGNESRNAGDIAADYLRDRGRDTLDCLVLTHFHADHAGGVLELMERVKVSALVVPDVEADSPLRAEILALAAEKGTQIVTVGSDIDFSVGSAHVTLYAPLGAGSANEAGLSLLVVSGGFEALLTGDMDATVEKRLVKYGDLPDVDLLVAGHHGAKHATSQLLLDTVTPELVAVSAGYNTYGHPTPETMTRIDEAGADLYRTDLQGHITITVG